jgi:hypothetical protein
METNIPGVVLPEGPGDLPRSGGLPSSPLFSNIARRFLTWLIARARGPCGSSCRIVWIVGAQKVSRTSSAGAAWALVGQLLTLEMDPRKV